LNFLHFVKWKNKSPSNQPLIRFLFLGLVPALLLGLLLGEISSCSYFEQRPNVILLTLDTTRADHLGCYGHNGGASPNLDQLAQQGVCFSEARSQVPITLPSHTSILTGTYPQIHGVHQHTDRFSHPDLRTLAEILLEQGYQTSAFIGARVLDAKFGLNRGIDSYFDKIGSRQDERPADSRRASQIIADARKWFSQRPDGPYFSWLHFYDPHLVFDPPEPYRQNFIDNPYLGEIAYMDNQIGEFLTWLRERGELENTIIVAIADHGESLGEHGIYGHTEYVYQEVLQIPLIISWPGKIPEGRVVNELVRSIDLMPTVLDFLGLSIPEFVQGESLRGLLGNRDEAGPEVENRVSFFESRYLENLFGWSALEGVEYRGNKYIRSPRCELYDLVQDPRENDNLCQSAGPLGRRMVRLLDDAVNESSPEISGPNEPPKENQSIDPQTREALSSLGYASPKPRALPINSSGEDPKDHIESVRLFQGIMRGPDNQSTSEDLARIAKLATLEPDQPGIQEIYGDFLLYFEKLEAAESVYKQVTILTPRNPSPHLKLYNLARKLGDTIGASEHLFAAHQADSLDTTVLYEIAEQAARNQDFNRAETYYRRSLSLHSESVQTLGHLAALLIYTNRQAEAVPFLQKSFEIPGQERVELAFRHFLLGQSLFQQPEQWDLAKEHLQKAIGLQSEMDGPHCYLALIYERSGNAKEAGIHARQYLRINPNGPDATKMQELSSFY
jgi:arylsulfatase A-like enzyme